MHKSDLQDPLLALALRALTNSSGIVFQDVSQSHLRNQAIAALTSALARHAEVVPAGHVAVPVALDEAFAKEIALVSVLEDEDVDYASQVWPNVIELARQRSGQRQQMQDPLRLAALRVAALQFEKLDPAQTAALEELSACLLDLSASTVPTQG